MATKLPVFPKVKNKRSMLHIDHLCEFLHLIIENENSGIFFQKNGEYMNTSDMVKMIADIKAHKVIMLDGTAWMINILKKLPGKIGEIANKAFGDLAYDMNMSKYKQNYRLVSIKESIKRTEG